MTTRRRTNNDVRSTFDEAYYRRYYLDPRTRVQDGRSRARLAAFVFAYLAYLDVPVKRVLDLGCGLGGWRDELAAHHPDATYAGVESSEYLCETYGWERGTAAGYRGRGRYDLVICQGVLQYVDDAAFHASIANIARLCRGALFLELPTREDLQKNVDRTVTDGRVHRRSGAWCREVIGERLRNVGGGVWLPRDSDVVLYELEGST